MTAHVRQAVVAARDLDAVVARLQAELGLGEPFADELVGHFGLRNAVFALGGTFLEVVCPVRDDAPAARWLARRGGDAGYMVMCQVDDVAGARARAAAEGVREVFAVDLDDMGESHLHPVDMHGAIVAISEPRPAASWRWGGPGWEERAVGARVAGVVLAVADPGAAAARWRAVLGGDPAEAGVAFRADADQPGLVEIRVAGAQLATPVAVAGVRFVDAGAAAG